MTAGQATLEDAIANGIDLSSNAFMLIHGWTVGPLLLEFVAKFSDVINQKPMTVKSIAAVTKAEEGPLAITLRACRILGFVNFNAEDETFSAAHTVDVDELRSILRPSSKTATALQSIYAESVPPFRLPSNEAANCFDVWADHRQAWLNCKSKSLPILLDGIVLAPLLTSITYFARWNEDGLDFGKDSTTDQIDFSKLEIGQRTILGDMIDELGIGTMTPAGIGNISSKGSLALQRCYSYYVPTSYSPMLAEFNTILYEDAGWGFVGTGQDTEETEIHVERVLNVVGSGAQHQTLFKDLMRHISKVFGGEDFGSQPAFVVDTGSGDGHLLAHIYGHVRDHTPRGKRLNDYPLTMVGVDFNEESRMATAVNLSKQSIPHMVLFGDVGKPSGIISALQKRKVDPVKTLHVRSFLDHDRPYIAPEKPFPPGGVAAKFAKAQLADFVHLDKHGKPIAALELFASLVEHFERWGDALDGSFGLCMLEVMMLDVPTTQRFFNDCVSFHFDIVQCLSRQYMISPPAFAMGAAMAGLVPANVKAVQTYPEQGKYCRVLNQHLIKKPYRIRFADLEDLPTLWKLECHAWDENVRGSEDDLRRRLVTSPTTNLVCEVHGKVVSVLYMQRVRSVDVVDQQIFKRICEAHVDDGSVLQLIAICTDPEFNGRAIGSELRAFALHLARIDPSIETVIGVTRCRSFNKSSVTMQAYVDKHVAGELTDLVLEFHTSFGAKIVRLVRNFRPEDVDNHGIGVLIQYQVKELPSLASSPCRQLAKVKTQPNSVELICSMMDELGYAADQNDLMRGFFDYGMDSLELVRIRNKLSSVLSTELPATLLLDFPNVHDLAQQLDKDRGILDEPASGDEGQSTPGLAKISWEALKSQDLLSMLEQSKKLLGLPKYQKEFSELARKCYPDMCKYILAIERIMVEVEGIVFQTCGLIEDREWKTVQKGRGRWTDSLMKYWAEVPEIRAQSHEIMHLTRQDQVWC